MYVCISEEIAAYTCMHKHMYAHTHACMLACTNTRILIFAGNGCLLLLVSVAYSQNIELCSLMYDFLLGYCLMGVSLVECVLGSISLVVFCGKSLRPPLSLSLSCMCQCAVHVCVLVDVL